jgi:NAD(P)-dependent dehydrogenase (short-subunit alcohol dehydrogenase family)
MPDKPVALVTEANQGFGLQIAKDLVAHGATVLVGSRNLERGVGDQRIRRPRCLPDDAAAPSCRFR